MAEQPFERLLESNPPLLRRVEALVVEAHRRWYSSQGRADWSEPRAYHWLHYEDPDPVARLTEGVRRLPVEYEHQEVAALERLARDLGWPAERT